MKDFSCAHCGIVNPLRGNLKTVLLWEKKWLTELYFEIPDFNKYNIIK